MKMNPESQSAPSLVGVDRLIHEPSRSVILAVLSAVESADFLYLLRETSLTKGNLTVHLSKLEAAGYIEIEKTYRGKLPLTLCHMTDKGRMAFKNYRQQLRNFLNNSRSE
jgi:DNA-binding MarR family transcriptional regulator